MIRVFKHYVPNAVLLLGLLDVLLLLAAAEAGWEVRAWQIGIAVGSVWTRLPQLVSFAGPLMIAMVAVGAYQADVLVSIRQAAMRLMVARAALLERGSGLADDDLAWERVVHWEALLYGWRDTRQTSASVVRAVTRAYLAEAWHWRDHVARKSTWDAMREACERWVEPPDIHGG